MGFSIPECGCNRTGSRDLICEKYDGQCPCKPGVTGKKCDRCLPRFYNFTSNGCTRKYYWDIIYNLKVKSHWQHRVYRKCLSRRYHSLSERGWSCFSTFSHLLMFAEAASLPVCNFYLKVFRSSNSSNVPRNVYLCRPLYIFPFLRTISIWLSSFSHSSFWLCFVKLLEVYDDLFCNNYACVRSLNMWRFAWLINCCLSCCF